MDELIEYGWIAGIVCLLLVPVNLYFYFTTDSVFNLVVAIFVGLVGILNLATYKM